MIHTGKGFSVVKEGEVVVFMELPCFLHNPTNVVNLVSGSSASSKTNLYIWKFSVNVLLKPSLKDFEHNLVSKWSEPNCIVVWTFFGISLLWDWNVNTFSSPVVPAEFSKFPDLEISKFLQFKSEFFNKEFMIWATVSSWPSFCWLYRTSPTLASKNIINLI